MSDNRIDILIEATEPLLALFATCDDVFTESGAFDRSNISLGRIYREWKKVRKHFDPDWDGKVESITDGP